MPIVNPPAYDVLIRQPLKQTNAACREGVQEMEAKIRSVLSSSFVHSFIHSSIPSFLHLLGRLQWLLPHLSASEQLFSFHPFSSQQPERAPSMINNHVLPSREHPSARMKFSCDR